MPACRPTACVPQVSKVFHVYTDATPLRVALVTGQKSLAKEQESLTQRTWVLWGAQSWGPAAREQEVSFPPPYRTNGYRSLADIVVATPGRLVDHIDQTPGFCLQQLRFLVVPHRSPPRAAAGFSREQSSPARASDPRRSLMRLTAWWTACTSPGYRGWWLRPSGVTAQQSRVECGRGCSRRL